MKLYRIAPVLLLALLLLLAGCAAGYSQEKPFSANDTPTTDDYITAAEAESAALAHAGIAAEDALGLRSKLDYDDGIAEYDVDLCYDGTEFDYEINAVTGEVIRVEKDRCDHAHTAPTDTPAKDSTTTTDKISGDEAVSIALTHAGLSQSDVQRIEVDYDRDHDEEKYEVSFHHDGYEYDYDIDAVTGEIIRNEKERDD